MIELSFFEEYDGVDGKKATVLNIEEIFENEVLKNYIVSLKYDDKRLDIITDYLELKWNFLAESPKYKSPPKKEKKNLQLEYLLIGKESLLIDMLLHLLNHIVNFQSMISIYMILLMNL